MTRCSIMVDVLYGIPCVGKSTAAIELAYRRGVRTVIQTDYIREVQRGYVPVEQSPALAKVTHTAWELYGSPSRENIVSGFLDHVGQVVPGIMVVTRKLVRDGFNAVMEGAHFHSGLLESIYAFGDVDLRPVLLTVASADELRSRIKDKEGRRARSSERKGWNTNVSVMLAIQDYLVADARSHGICIVAGNEWRDSCARIARST